MLNRRKILFGAAGAALGIPAASAQRAAKPRNILFILTDDHRYDAIGFLKSQKFLETPHLDSLARDGVHCKNAFVTTALCSPSRASILTGKYAHQHKIVDNNTPIPKGTRFFSQDLQQAGYSTAFFGKWHMGGAGDEPQPGFDHWVSFKGQGSYLPNPNGLNVDGKHVPQKGYITDELTDYALDWLNGREKNKPWMMYLSHKAVHADSFRPNVTRASMPTRCSFLRPRWTPKAIWRGIAPCGSKTSAIAGTEWIIPITATLAGGILQALR
jgi:Arylsulfatase A and related enzymes